LDSTNEEEVRKAVEKLANKVFEDTKKRICKNVILKFYNFFLIPMYDFYK
jgi:ribosomal protein S7